MHLIRRSLLFSVLLTATWGGGLAVASAPAFAAGLTASHIGLSTTTPSIAFGQSALLRAQVKPLTGTGAPTGTVTFAEGTTTLATGALATINGAQLARVSINGLTVGTHTITATYSGDTTYAASTSKPVTVVVAKAATTTKILANKTTKPGKYNLTTIVTFKTAPAPTGTVQYTIDGAAPITVTLQSTARAHLITTFIVGTSHTVTVNYSGDANYLASTASITFTA